MNNTKITQIRGTTKVENTERNILYQRICKRDNIHITFDTTQIILIEIGYKTNLENKNNLTLKTVELVYDYLQSRGFDKTEIHEFRLIKGLKEKDETAFISYLPLDSIYNAVIQLTVYPQ